MQAEKTDRQVDAVDEADDKVTVWFDGACPLCIREIRAMRRLDRRGRIRFVEARSATGCPIATDDLLARFHAREPGRPIVSGAAAFAAMWRVIPLFKPIGHIARIPPVLWLLELGYRGFLRVRPRLQRWVRDITGENPDLYRAQTYRAQTDTASSARPPK